MIILFTDIDGVCNSLSFLQSRSYNKPFSKKEKMSMLVGNVDIIDLRQINSKTIKQLNRIVLATGAKIVISSDWRIGFNINQLTAIFNHHGFIGQIIGTTPDLMMGRGLDIQQWLDDTNLQIDKFAIVDDDSDMSHLTPFLIKTNPAHGLTKSKADEIIRMLTN